jgi:hypothetical protein
MTDSVARLSAVLADRYVIERELGAGGSEPRFAAGGELFIRARDTVFVSRVEPGVEPRIGAAKALFGGVFNTSNSEPDWDVSPDGTRFVMVRNVAGAVGHIGLYLNWADRWRARQR